MNETRPPVAPPANQPGHPAAPRPAGQPFPAQPLRPPTAVRPPAAPLPVGHHPAPAHPHAPTAPHAPQHARPSTASMPNVTPEAVDLDPIALVEEDQGEDLMTSGPTAPA